MDSKAVLHRWYLPNPAWLVWAAVATTAGLFACEQWRWFSIGEQKGHAVLAALVVVAAVMVLLPVWMLIGLVFRRRVQFGLKTLLVFVTLCALVCSWLAVRIRQARRQEEAISTIQNKLHGCVWYDSGFGFGDCDPLENPPRQESGSLTALLGNNFFHEATVAGVDAPEVTDDELAWVGRLTGLSMLFLDCPNITDAGLTHLSRLTKLSHLRLKSVKVTDQGIQRLQRILPECRIDVVRDGE